MPSRKFSYDVQGSQDMKRINYLDGHRGIAILLVVGFHAYTRWPELVPYGDSYSYIFQYGFLGVQLFFLLSGFVILMTLERCTTFSNFLYKRWLRLFPAMLVCSLIIFFTAPFFFERPAGIPSAKDLIPGLLLLEPIILSKLIGQVASVEGAFWSIYVEVKFYVISGALYFLVGSRKMILGLFTFFLFSIFSSNLQEHFDNQLLGYATSISFYLSFKYFGWFAAGCAFYMFSKTKEKTWFVYALTICILSSIATAAGGKSLGTFAAMLAISSLFALTLISSKAQKVVGNRYLVYFGFISYPLYLVHENMMISLIIKLGAILPQDFHMFLPIYGVFFVSSIAYIIVKYIEGPVKNGLDYIIQNKAVMRWRKEK